MVLHCWTFLFSCRGVFGTKHILMWALYVRYICSLVFPSIMGDSLPTLCFSPPMPLRCFHHPTKSTCFDRGLQSGICDFPCSPDLPATQQCCVQRAEVRACSPTKQWVGYCWFWLPAKPWGKPITASSWAQWVPTTLDYLLIKTGEVLAEHIV